MSKINTVLFVGAAALAIAACGPSQPEPAEPGAAATEPDEPAATEPGEPAAAGTPAGFDTPWSEMDHDQKKKVMKEVVVPQVASKFEEFDPDEYSDPKCTLCHGEDALVGDFEMPNDNLPELDFGGPGWDEYAAEHEEIMDFMKNDVVPGMVSALGVEPYDPETQTGFGCFNCHTKK